MSRGTVDNPVPSTDDQVTSDTHGSATDNHMHPIQPSVKSSSG